MENITRRFDECQTLEEMKQFTEELVQHHKDKEESEGRDPEELGELNALHRIVRLVDGVTNPNIKKLWEQTRLIQTAKSAEKIANSKLFPKKSRKNIH